MAQGHQANQEQGFNRAVGEAKRQAANVADATSIAERKTVGSFGTAVRDRS